MVPRSRAAPQPRPAPPSGRRPSRRRRPSCSARVAGTSPHGQLPRRPSRTLSSRSRAKRGRRSIAAQYLAATGAGLTSGRPWVPRCRACRCLSAGRRRPGRTGRRPRAQQGTRIHRATDRLERDDRRTHDASCRSLSEQASGSGRRFVAHMTMTIFPRACPSPWYRRASGTSLKARAPIDDRRDLAGFDELLQNSQVLSVVPHDEHPHPLAHKRR